MTRLPTILVRMTCGEVDREPVRVLFVDHVPFLSGGERSMLDLVRHLDPSRVRAALACPGPGPLSLAFEALGLDVHILPIDRDLAHTSRYSSWAGLLSPGRWLAIGRTARALAGIIERGGHQTLHTNSLKAHALGLAAARHAGVPVVWHLRDILPATILGRTLARLGLRLADRILAISGAVAAAVRASLPVADLEHAPIDIAPNAIALPMARSRRAARHAAGLPARGPLVAWVGQLARWKGPLEFLDLAAATARRWPDARFLMIGRVLFATNERGLEAEIERKIARLGLGDRLLRLGGRDDVPDLLAAVDTLVHTSIAPEPSGRVILEAMAAGVPVVAADAGGVPELVVDSHAGFLAPPGDTGAYVRAVDAILSDPARARRMGATGRRIVLDRHAPARLADRVASIHEELAARSPLARLAGGHG